jgi:hypothetical protein
MSRWEPASRAVRDPAPYGFPGGVRSPFSALDSMTPGFRQLLNRFAMIGFEHQIALRDALGDDPDWRVSPREGTATFDGKPYAIQVLGTRADVGNTWLWAWANAKGGVPAKALEAVKKVRQTGKKRSIGELEVEALPLDNFDFDAHTLALVATGVAGLPAYFRFPYEGGALYAAFEGAPLQLPAPDLNRIAHVINESLERFDIEERTAFTAYVETLGAKVGGTKLNPVAQWPDGRTLPVTFDEQGRLTGIQLVSGARPVHPRGETRADSSPS